MKKYFYMFVGIPGTGKSTFRSQLEKKFPKASILSTDDKLELIARTMSLTYKDAFESYMKSSAIEMMADLTLAIELGNSIIHDQTNLTAKKRKLILSKIPDDYIKIACVFMPKSGKLTDAQYETVMRRLRIRRKNSDLNKDVPLDVISTMLNYYQLPQLFEGFDSIEYHCNL